MTGSDRAKLAHDTATAEGLRLSAYQDSVGVWTIGYGTNLQELVIDRQQAETWLADKLARSERECEQFPWWPVLGARRQRAICELVYNMGLPRLLGFSKMLAAITRHDFDAAAAELLESRWAQQVGPTRAQRIAEMLRAG